MRTNQLIDENDPSKVDLRINGDEYDEEKQILNRSCDQRAAETRNGNTIHTELQEYQQNVPYISPLKGVILKVETPNRFGVTTLELIIMGPLAIILCVYQLSSVAQKTFVIQDQTPMKGVVAGLGISEMTQIFNGKLSEEICHNSFYQQAYIVLFPAQQKSITKIDHMYQYFIYCKDKFKYQIYFYSLTGIIFLIFIMKGGFLVWLFFTLSHYGIQKALYNFRFYSQILWAYSILILYYISYCEDQPFQILSYVFPKLGGTIHESHLNALISWNWITNLTLLRVMSFCLDKHWQYLDSYKFDQKQHEMKCLICSQGKSCYKSRTENYLEPQYYDSIIYYYAYLTYLPLFLVGPEMTFNAFISQVLQNQNSIPKSKVIVYFARALNNILVLELYTHISFGSALSKIAQNRPYWIDFSFSECLFMGYLNLTFLWLKCLTIWRLARAFSLLDGIDCPENMNRCIFNNYSFEGFWRSWHRGFNQWLIRYIFIPLGGSRTKYWNIWIVFTFVAVWHDFTLNFILWAWFICAALIPEMFVKNWFNRKTSLWQTWWFRYLCCLAAVIQNWLMILVNIIGFGQGYDVRNILERLLVPDGIKQVLIVICFMYFVPIIEFYIRDKEGHYKGF